MDQSFLAFSSCHLSRLHFSPVVARDLFFFCFLFSSSLISNRSIKQWYSQTRQQTKADRKIGQMVPVIFLSEMYRPFKLCICLWKDFQVADPSYKWSNQQQGSALQRVKLCGHQLLMKMWSCKWAQTDWELWRIQGAGYLVGPNSLLDEVKTSPVLPHTLNFLTHFGECPSSKISEHKTRTMTLSAGEVPWESPLGSSLMTAHRIWPQGRHLFPHTWVAQPICQADDFIMWQGKQGSKNPCCWKEQSSPGCAEPTLSDAAAGMHS